MRKEGESRGYGHLHKNIVTAGCTILLAVEVTWNCQYLHGDMNKFDHITDEPHDSETDRDSLRNLNKFYVARRAHK